MRMFTRLTALVFVFASLTTTGIASAQTAYGPPDDRYNQRVEGQPRYPSSLIPAFPAAPTPEQLIKCMESAPYEPADTHLMQYTNRVKIARVRIQVTNECTGMRTAAGDKLVLRVAGTQVAVDELGRDLFDFGSPNGPPCGNPRIYSIPFNIQKPAPARPTPSPAPVVTPRIPPPPPAPTTTPATAPQTPVPAVTRQATRKPAPKDKPKPEEGPSFSIGVGYIFGSNNTNYVYPDPKVGDVPQRHSFASPVLTARFDQGPRDGVFAEVSSTFLGKTSAMEFQDITGAWNGKKRDTDSSRDKMLGIKAGYKFGLGDTMSVGVSLNYDSTCFCEKYFAQNTNTETERSFSNLGLGVEAAASTDSRKHRTTVRVAGTLGLTGHRNKWTTQHYNGPPAIDFPKVTDQEESAKQHQIGAEVDVQAMGGLHVFGGITRSAWSSTRPTDHTAHEDTTSMGTMVGVRWRF